MQFYEKVKGTAEWAKPIIIGKDIVYVHENIKKLEDEEGMYEYDEYQYDKDDYLLLLSNENVALKKELLEIMNTIEQLMTELLAPKGTEGSEVVEGEV